MHSQRSVGVTSEAETITLLTDSVQINVAFNVLKQKMDSIQALRQKIWKRN